MTPLPRWRLGEPLAIALEDLASGKTGTETISVGRIVWSRQRRVAVFEPDAQAVARRIPLSPHGLPLVPGLKPGDPAEFGGLHGIFADSLPDGWGTLLVDREAEARGLRRSDLTPVDRLAITGTAGMGALTYRPEAEAGGDAPAPDLSALALTAERVLAQADEPDLRDLHRLREALGGSGGARPKIVCQLETGAGDDAGLRPAFAPPDPAFSHWIVKFNAAEDGPDAAAVEYAYALMALAAGIDMPPVRLIRGSDGRRFFAVRRFDRDVVVQGGVARMRRFHMLSASGALESEHRHFAFDYTALLTWIGQLTGDVRAVDQAFRRAAFNAMAHNRDDHGRQHSALMDLDDGRRWRWRLAPAYDLTPSAGPGGEHSLSIGGAGRDVDAAHLLRLASNAGVARDRAADIMAEVAAAIMRWHEFSGIAGVALGVQRAVARLHRPVEAAG